MPITNVTSKNHQVLIIHDEPLDLLAGVKFVSSPKCGAINTFSGTVRDMDFSIRDHPKKSLPIEAIHYEAYESMALRQISSIIEETIRQAHHLEADTNFRVYVAIRLGRVPVQETSIVICASSTSRHCSHKATMIILEKVKSLATIWKKIIFTDGHEEWASQSESEAFWLKRDSSRAANNHSQISSNNNKLVPL